ncbi:MAG: HTTM domain-containing protein [Deltaproteobacteria bacterium]|nr:HTTM domain-containing protein [Deltaproteobacteria bacterium]
MPWLLRPVDGAGLAVFRILFGLLMCGGLVRFMLSGWIERFYGQPTFFFKYPGFEWIEPLSVGGMYALYATLAVLGLFIAGGLFYRASVALFLLGFSYAQLIDVTNYLNHYYLVCWLCVLLLVVPAHRLWSLDARRKPALRSATIPAWAVYLLRFQVGMVYFFAGLAKLNTDWLLHAQPLGIWLSARTETAIIGPWLDEIWVAFLFSWAGFLFDLTIAAWLSWRKTRTGAYLVLLLFHFMTHVFFNIGLFPFIMTLAATVFFDPGWPRRLLGSARPTLASIPRPAWTTRRRATAAIAGAYVLFSVLVPLRHYLYPGDVSWNEEGMRWSWKVMLREKHGAVTYFVRLEDGRELEISPRRYLGARQEREMAGQPDLIVQLARHIGNDFRRRGYGPVEVRAEALVSWNGRPAHPMIDPSADLLKVDASLAPAHWILPEPSSKPIRLRPRARL